MKKYNDFIKESKDIWQRKSTKDESYGPIYYIKRDDFHCGVNDGDIVKLDKEYIQNLDFIQFRPQRKNDINWKFKDSDYEKEYVLVNYEYYYGYALRNVFSHDTDFMGWVPTGYVRHLTEEEMEDYLYRKNVIENSKKFNI